MKNLFNLSLLLAVGFSAGTVSGQNTFNQQVILQWPDQLFYQPAEGEPIFYLDFEGAARWSEEPALPVYPISIPLGSDGLLTTTLSDEIWEDWPAMLSDPEIFSRIPEEMALDLWIAETRGNYTAQGYILPLRKNGQKIQRLISAKLQISFSPSTEPTVVLRSGHTEESVLAFGTIYKIAVDKEGVYKLSYDFLKNTLKMPVDQIDPRRIHIYGNGGGMVPRANAKFRHDDLAENAIYVNGEADGVFNNSDYILFYAPGPHPFQYNEAQNMLTRPINLYDRQSYYYIKVEPIDGLRISEKPSEEPGAAPSTNIFRDMVRMEDELTNLLNEGNLNHGSGSQWYGDKLSSALKTINYTGRFDFQGLVPGSTAMINAAFASRSDVSNRFTLNLDGQVFQTNLIGSTNLGNIESRYANRGTITQEFTISQKPETISVGYTANGTNATGWVDYIEFHFDRNLEVSQSYLRFNNSDYLSEEKITMNLIGFSENTRIWEVSDPVQPRNQLFQKNGNTASFTQLCDTFRLFVALDVKGDYPEPSFVGEVANQNLHGILEAEMAIIYHPLFKEAADKLAEHRRNYSGLKVVTADIFEIYNEFASGSTDPFAIRDFARMLYLRDSTFRYLLFLGDGSFDQRNVLGKTTHKNYIPVFETDESLDPIFAFPTDNPFALMGEDEGEKISGESLDLAVGRIPVETAQEAANVVDKIINYDTNPKTFGDWRIRTVFIADDEDNNLHMNDADALAENTQTVVPMLNMDKVYLDAFKQVATSGGQRYPDANKAFNNAMFRGSLLVNYLGHGGTSGWTQERVVQIEDILSWTNKDRLPLFLTATCTFAAFDNPEIKTGGEQVLLNPNGGGIALFSTVRPVYASLNRDLAQKTLQEIFAESNPWEQSIGEILRRGKNKRGNTSNDQKFLLLGDPAQILAFPGLRVSTTRINNIEVDPESNVPVDTLKALQVVTIEGQIEDHNGQLMTDFNGIVYPTLFDKAKQVKTLGNDPGSPIREFRLQNSILYKGAATVTAGKFTFTFTVPQNINFVIGEGKLSYYAWDKGVRDAGGSFENFIIYGLDESGEIDNTPPQVSVFMNGPDWAFGGLTSDRPELYVELFDDNGFNFSGNSIGQDAIGILNENTNATFVLNDFFTPELDDSRRGTIRFPLGKLEPGRYNLKVRAWDIFNNPGEGFTEFVVGTLENGALAHVLNFPNPVTDHTRFRFEHNLAGQTLDVTIRIYDMTGREVKILRSSFFAESNRVSDIEWDALDVNGRPLPRGIYLYKVHISAADGLRKGQEAESTVEKLVLLK